MAGQSCAQSWSVARDFINGAMLIVSRTRSLDAATKRWAPLNHGNPSTEQPTALPPGSRIGAEKRFSGGKYPRLRRLLSSLFT